MHRTTISRFLTRLLRLRGLLVPLRVIGESSLGDSEDRRSLERLFLPSVATVPVPVRTDAGSRR